MDSNPPPGLMLDALAERLDHEALQAEISRIVLASGCYLWRMDAVRLLWLEHCPDARR